MSVDAVDDRHSPGDVLLHPREVAELLRVDAKTVSRWAAAGRIPAIRTPGGHRRYPSKYVYAIIDGTAPRQDLYP